MRAFLRVAVAGAAATLLLGSCSLWTRPEGVVEGRPTAERFELTGRMAVRYEGEGYSGSLRWNHADGRDRLELYGPAGLFYARLSKGPEGASMVTSDGKTYSEPDAESLARAVLGWDLPLEELRHWLFARPAPGSAPTRIELDANGRPTVIEQNGWNISYLAYTTVGIDVLPSRIDLDHAGLKVRLIVSRWRDPGKTLP